jgi:hypothetical protein
MQVIPPANERRHMLVNLCLKAPAYVEPWITPIDAITGAVTVRGEKRYLKDALFGTDVNRFNCPRPLAYNIGFADRVLWVDLAKEPVSALHLALLLGSYEKGRGGQDFKISEQGARHLARVAASVIWKDNAPNYETILNNDNMDVFGAREGQSALTWPSPAEPYDDYARERVPTFNDKLLAPVMLWGGEWEHLAGHAMQVLNKINKVVGKILTPANAAKDKTEVKAPETDTKAPETGAEAPGALWERAKAIERQKARNKEKNNLRLILRLERHYAQLQAKVTTRRLAGLRYLQRTVPYVLRRFPVKGIAYEDLTFQKAGLTAPAGFTGGAAQAMKSMPKRFGEWVASAFWYLQGMKMWPSTGLRRAAVSAMGTSQICANHPDPPQQGHVDRQGSNDTGVCSVGRETFTDDKGKRQEGPEIMISHDSAAGIIAYSGHAVLSKKDAERAEKKRKREEAAKGIAGDTGGTGPP